MSLRSDIIRERERVEAWLRHGAIRGDEPWWPARLVARVASRLWRDRAEIDYTSREGDAYARLCEDLRLYPGDAVESVQFSRALACARLVGTGDGAWHPGWAGASTRDIALQGVDTSWRGLCLSAGVPAEQIDELLRHVHQNGLDLDEVLLSLVLRGGR